MISFGSFSHLLLCNALFGIFHGTSDVFCLIQLKSCLCYSIELQPAYQNIVPKVPLKMDGFMGQPITSEYRPVYPD